MKLLPPGCGQTLRAGLSPHSSVSPVDGFRQQNPKLFIICVCKSRHSRPLAGADAPGGGLGSGRCSRRAPTCTPPQPCPAASLVGGGTCVQTLEKRSPTSHLFWRNELEWPQSSASCWRRGGARSRAWGAVVHPGAARRLESGVINRLQDRSPASPACRGRAGARSARWPPFSAGGFSNSVLGSPAAAAPAPAGGRRPGTGRSEAEP